MDTVIDDNAASVEIGGCEREKEDDIYEAA